MLDTCHVVGAVRLYIYWPLVSVHKLSLNVIQVTEITNVYLFTKARPVPHSRSARI